MKKKVFALGILAAALIMAACSSMKQLWSLEGILVSHDGLYYTGKSATVVIDYSKGNDFEFTATSKPVDNGYPVSIYTNWQGSSPCLSVGQNGVAPGQYTIRATRTGYGLVIADCGGYKFTFIVYAVDPKNGITMEKLEAQRQEYLEAEARRIAEEKAAREAAEALKRARKNLNGLWIVNSNNSEKGLWFTSNGKFYPSHVVVASKGNKKWVYSETPAGTVTDELEFNSGLGKFTYEDYNLSLLDNSGRQFYYTKSRSSASAARYLRSTDTIKIVVPAECISTKSTLFTCNMLTVDEELDYAWYVDNSFVHAPKKSECSVWLAEGAHSVYVEVTGKTSRIKIRSKISSIYCKPPVVENQISSDSPSNVTVVRIQPDSPSSGTVENVQPQTASYNLSSCGGLWISSSDSKSGLYIEPNSGVVYEAFVKYNASNWVFISEKPLGKMDRSMNFSAYNDHSKINMVSSSKLNSVFNNTAGKNVGGTYNRNGGSAGTANLMKSNSTVNLSSGNNYITCGSNQFDEPVTYRWYENGKKSNCTSEKYVLGSGNNGSTMYVEVTGTKSGITKKSNSIVVQIAE